jgi:hypothetical protein
MSAETLISFAGAHGVNLIQAAKMETNAKRLPDEKKRRAGGIEILEPRANRARGKESIVMQRPEWTLAEIGQAAQDVPEEAFRCALFAYAGLRDEHLWFLQSALTGHGRMFSRIYHWPDRVRDSFGLKVEYLPRLALLVLWEDAFPQLFKVAPQIYPLFMGISVSSWEKQVEGCFTELKHGVWNDWLGLAARRIQARLSMHEEGIECLSIRSRPAGKRQSQLLGELETRYRRGETRWSESRTREIGRVLGMPDQSSRDAVKGLCEAGYLARDGEHLTLNWSTLTDEAA